MAYIDPNQDENQDKSANAPAGSSSNQAPSSSGSVGGTSAPGSYSAAAPSSGTKGTGFQNLNSYLDANQGNNLGGQVADKIGSQATAAQNDLNTAQTGFNSQVDQNTVNQDSNNVQRVLNDPTKASADDTAKFQAQENANFGGPTTSSGYQDYVKANTEGQNAYESGKAAQSEGGRMALLNNYFGNPTYGKGQQTLDQSLLSGGDQTQLNSAISQTQNLPSTLQSAGHDMDKYAAQGAATTAQTREATRKALGVDSAGNPLQTAVDASGKPVYAGAIGSIQNAVQGQVSQLGANYAGGNDAISSAIKAGDFSKLTPQQLQGLGGLNNYKGSLYNVDPTQYLTTNANNPTNNTVITPDQAAKLQALYSLAGTTNNFAPDASLAGTNAPSFTYDNSGFQNAIQQGSAALNHTLTSAFTPNLSGVKQLGGVGAYAGAANNLESQYKYAAAHLAADQAMAAKEPNITAPGSLTPQGHANLAQDQAIIAAYQKALADAGFNQSYGGQTSAVPGSAPLKAVKR